MGARGAPRGSLMCHSYSVLRTDNCRHVRGRCQATPWTGVHNHRNPEPQEIQYLKVQYHARVFLARTGSMVGLTAKLVEKYHLRWPANVLYDSMKDLAATCARTGRIWPRAPIWHEDPEWLVYRRRMRAARRRAGAARADGEGVQALEPAGEGVQTPEPIGEGVRAPEQAGEGVHAPEPAGEGNQIPEPAGEDALSPEQAGEVAQ